MAQSLARLRFLSLQLLHRALQCLQFDLNFFPYPPRPSTYLEIPNGAVLLGHVRLELGHLVIGRLPLGQQLLHLLHQLSHLRIVTLSRLGQRGLRDARLLRNPGWCLKCRFPIKEEGPLQ